MRIGQNPLKTQETAISTPERLTIGVLNCIPETSGYFKQQLEVLQLCLASIRNNADEPIDLLVFDNGSCLPVVEYLQAELAEARIDYLILSRRNIGKANALLQILKSAPGDLVFFTDGDIYFKPGWVGAHLEVMGLTDGVGVVGGVPLRNQAEYTHTINSKALLNEHFDGEIEVGQLIPEEWTREFLYSVGVPPAEQDDYLKEWAALDDCRISRGGVSAYVGASHMQFLASRRAIDSLPHQRFEKALDPEEDHFIDRAIDEGDLLRLSTSAPYVYHIGNRITERWLTEEFERLVNRVPEFSKKVETRKRHWFWGRGKVRSAMRWLSDWLFERYYPTG